MFLKPDVFIRLPKDDCHRLPVTVLVSLICRALSQQHLYASLAQFSVGDPSSEHLMSIDAVEDWLYKISSRLLQIQKMTEQFLPLWVFTAAHTIAFFHGKQTTSRLRIPVPGSNRVGSTTTKIKIQDLIESNTMTQLLKLNKPVVEDMDSNVFARIRAVRYYDSFTVFDTSLLSNPPIFGGGYMNPLLIERVINGGPVMDYRKFLTFAIAWDNRKTEPGVKYFWPVFDNQNKGYLSIDDCVDFIESMVSILQTIPAVCGPQGPHAVQILKQEIIDIFKSYTRPWDEDVAEDRIFTLKQAIENPSAFGTVVGLLGNTQTFLEYECREETAHKNFLTKQLKEAKIAQIKTEQSSSNRVSQLSILQSIIDDAWLLQPPPITCKFDSFAEFLDYHETVYGGESMEPWLTRYYEWEEAEAAAALNSTLVADVSTSEIQTRE
jgi:hypothetical protein